VGCARCHDHKIDPIPQTDYYQMVAFFHELQPYGTRADQLSWNQTDISPPDIAAAHQEVDQQKRHLREQMEPIEQRGIVKMPAEDQRATEGPRRRKVLREKLQQYLSAEDWGQYVGLKAEWDRLDELQLPPRSSALSVKCLPEPPETTVMLRGNPHVPGDKVEPGFPELFGTPVPDLTSVSHGGESSGRRLVLADWIASPDNRLTARVMANRIWQHHFGRGIVRSSSNFGLLGDLPTHPELLDWLAAEFVNSGWRMKPLHKLILMSSAYQMSSRAEETALAQDPLNDLFWRFDMRRLSAEELRDSLHAVTGQLNLTMYGPGIYPEISEQVLAGQSMPGHGWGKSSPEEQARRAIYIHVKRSLITPILADFDFPETDSSCAARFATTQPAQALGMLNGAFLHKQAAAFAARVRKDAGEDRRAQVARALRLALGRETDEANIERGLTLIETFRTKHGASEERALEYYCLMVLNLNEFVYLD
jgi:hypothetical protein